MTRKKAIRVLGKRRARATGEYAAALDLAMESLVAAEKTRGREIDQAVAMIREAVTGADGTLNKRAWGYLKNRIGFPPEDKAEIVRRVETTPGRK